MGAVQGTIGLAPSKVAPRGLGTGEVESFTGYAARMSATIAVPPRVFMHRAFEDVAGETGTSTPSVVTAAARRLNVGGRSSDVADAVSRLTGHPDLRRLSYFAFVDLFGVGERGVLARRRRWCPQCWVDDGAEPYERKVWWLALVDVCHLHRCLLESRCPQCGRFQPTLPHAVRLHVCSYCGHDLYGAEPISVSGARFERMLWYACEGACLVHAGEAIALTGSDERESLERAYDRLAVLAGERGLPGVQRFFAEEINRMSEAKLEALMSALWRLQVSVLKLFSESVGVMVARG